MTPRDMTPGEDMSPGEKAAAEWEARHDTRARGGRANPAAVQEYLLRARVQEQEEPLHPTVRPARPADPRPAPGAGPARRSWLRRLRGQLLGRR